MAARNFDGVIKHLVSFLGKDQIPDPDPIDLLTRYLKKIRVHRLKLSDFQPSKRTLEDSDINQIVSEFETFLRVTLQVDDNDELPIIELE